MADPVESPTISLELWQAIAHYGPCYRAVMNGFFVGDDRAKLHAAHAEIAVLVEDLVRAIAADRVRWLQERIEGLSYQDALILHQAACAAEVSDGQFEHHWRAVLRRLLVPEGT